MFCWSKSHRRKKVTSTTVTKTRSSSSKLKVSLVNGGSFACDFDLLAGNDDSSPLFRQPSSAKSELLLLQNYDTLDNDDEEFDHMNYRSLWGKDLHEFDRSKRAQSCNILNVGDRDDDVEDEPLLPTPPPTPPEEEEQQGQITITPSHYYVEGENYNTEPSNKEGVDNMGILLPPEDEYEEPSLPITNPVSLRLEQLRVNLATNKSEIHELISCLRAAGSTPTTTSTPQTSTTTQTEEIVKVSTITTLDKATMTITSDPLNGTHFIPPNITSSSSRYPSWIGVGIPVSPPTTEEEDNFHHHHHPSLRRWEELDYSPGGESSSLGSSSGDSSLVLINNLKNSLNLTFIPGREGGGSDGSGSVVSNYESYESYQERDAGNTNGVDHSLDHNRISTSGSHPAPISKSKEGVTTRSRSRRDEKDHHLESATPTLREQLARLKQEVDRLQGEHVVKDGQLQELTAITNQTEEERVRLVTELAACSRKVEAMAIVLQNTVDKSDIATSHTHTANQRICQLESLLKNAENELKQVPVLKEKMDMNDGMHLKEIVKHKRAHKKDVEKLKSEFLQQIDESRSSYEEKLVEQEKAHCQELDRLKEVHRLEMESYRERHINMSPHDVLIKDVASMSAVIEMNNLKMKDMQTRIQVLTMKEEELIKCENLVRTLSARVEDVEAQLNLNKDEKLSLLAKLTEAELALVDAAGKNKSLAQSVDELSFKLNNPDIVPASPSASNFKEPA